MVTLDEGSTCSNHFDLPSRTITLEGGGGGATLTGQSKGNFQILAGHNVGGTTIRNLTFVEGLSQDNGGAIRLTGDSPVTIERNTFLGNSAGVDGGAISIDSQAQGPIENRAGRGDASPVILSGNTFGSGDEGDENSAGSRGGAVYINQPFRPVVVTEGNEFVDNESESDGGGLYVEAADDFILLDNFFENNQSGGDGGGGAAHVCSIAEVTGNEFVDNEASAVDHSFEGGGLALYHDACRDVLEKGARIRGADVPNLTQSGNLFDGNSVSGEFSSGAGGGEHVEGFGMRSTNDSFVGNEISGVSFGFGGGLAYIGSSGQTLQVRNLVAAGNEVSTSAPSGSRGFNNQGAGGGLFLVSNSGAMLQIEDSTIEGNAAAEGSGISGVTFGGEQQPTRGAAPPQLVIQNSIVFGNQGANDSPDDSTDGEIAGFTNKQVSFSDVCKAPATPHDGTGNLCANPGLADPDSDGDVDQSASSPTVNNGDASLVDGDLTQDYAGDARVIGGKVDMGADEYKPATQPPPDEPGPTTQQPAPPAAGGVAGVQQKSCKSRRAFRIRIRVPKGKTALSAVVRVNGKKVRVVRGKRLRAPVRLRGLPKGKFRVRITIRLANGRKISGVRTYHTCIPKLPGDGPPQV